MEETELQIDALNESIDKEEEARIFSEINKIEGVGEYLRGVLANDLRLHFSCAKTDQDLVRGGYFRVQHWMKLLKSNSNVDNK